MTKRKWIKKDETLLIELFKQKKSYNFMKEKLNRTRLSIYHRAKLIGIESDHMKSCKNQSILRKQGLRKCYMCGKIFLLSSFTNKDRRCKECNKIKSKKDRRSAPKDKIFYIRWRDAKKRSIKNNLNFSISVDDIKQQYIKQNGICYYTGNILQVKIVSRKKSFNSISIDRINSKQGYTKQNIVLCSIGVNKMKNNLDVGDFINLCKKICNFNDEKFGLTGCYKILHRAQ